MGTLWLSTFPRVPALLKDVTYVLMGFLFICWDRNQLINLRMLFPCVIPLQLPVEKYFCTTKKVQTSRQSPDQSSLLFVVIGSLWNRKALCLERCQLHF